VVTAVTSTNGAPATAETPSSPPVPSHHALVFVGAASERAADQAVETIADKLRAGLEAAAPAAATFAVEPKTRAEKFGRGGSTTVASLVRRDRERVVAVIDVYRFEVAEPLRKEYAGQSALKNLWLSLVLLVFFLPLIGKRFWATSRRTGLERTPDRRLRPHHGWRWRAQIAYALYLLGLQVVFVLVILYALAAALVPGLQGTLAAEIPQGVALALTTLGLTKKGLRRMTDSAVTAACTIYYLDSGYQRRELTGAFDALLRHIARAEPAYDTVDVVAFSFGTLVAFDALFPREERTPPPIHRLVTIGMPYETVKTYFPSYFENRNGRRRRTEWMNVWCAVDALSTKTFERGHAPTRSYEFGDTGKQTIGFVDLLLGYGLRSHSMYWCSRGIDESSAFVEIARWTYAGTPVVGAFVS
jgi:hypothetical protein